MKKIISLIMTAIVLCCLICSCGEKAGEFVAMDRDNIYSAAWASGGSNTIEGDILDNIVSIYNSLTPDGAVTDKLEQKAEWRIIATVTPEDANPTVFLISYIGDYRFCIKVEGAAKSEYTVTSEELYNAFIQTK